MDCGLALGIVPPSLRHVSNADQQYLDSSYSAGTGEIDFRFGGQFVGGRRRYLGSSTEQRY